MSEPDLSAVLTRATDRLEPRDMAGAAWAAAQRRRARRRAVITVAVVAVAAAGAVISTATDDRATGPVGEPSSPGVPSTSPTNVTSGTQPVWDPFDIESAPLRASTLPETLVPPAVQEQGTPPFQAMSRVVLAWPQEGRDLDLRGVDGSWQAVPDTQNAVEGTFHDVVRPVISSDGTQVAMATIAGVRVIDFTTGREMTIGWPADLAPPWDTAPQLAWQPGDEGLIALGWKIAWFIGLHGENHEAPYKGAYVALGVDPDGLVYQNDYDERSLLTWEGDELVHEAPFIQCERLTAGHGMVACTTGSLEPYRSGPVVVDPMTGGVIAYAPIKDRDSVYSDNGHLTAVGFLDEDTVLLLVGPIDYRTMDLGEEAWHLVAWEFRTGTFERITSGDDQMQHIVVAPGLLE